MTPANRKMVQIFGGMGALFSVLLIALGFKFYAALSTLEPTVARDYYEVGSEFDRHLAETKSTDNRMLSSAFFQTKQPIKIGEQDITVTYTESGSGQRPVASAEVSLLLSRRATTKQNSVTSCATDANGTCHLRVKFTGRGPWEAVLTAKDSGGHRRMVRTFIVEG
ncbi:MAG: FixH family protein [Spirochaetia bacterium]|nr:FixH family protein [Spirochaetia bacterium]